MKENLHQQLREADSRRRRFWKELEQAKQARDSAYQGYHDGVIDEVEYDEIGRQYRKACLAHELAVLAYKLLHSELPTKNTQQ